ncbi:MAG: molybdenum cofactor biosynthesis protein MoaE, partial [Dehalococcoidia bacterium]|nr:molybdenum cofactor biosynthesis protein MoaE [Dehalococcoidia bacterium]
MNIILTHAKLDQDALTASVTKPENGGLVTFLGVTRNHNEGRHVEYLEYEAYEEMALQELKRVAEQAKQKWPEVDIAIAHRLGRLEIGEVSLVIAVAAPHRKEAFAACAFAVDILKE